MADKIGLGLAAAAGVGVVTHAVIREIKSRVTPEKEEKRDKKGKG
jgi:hypothetical protein